MFEPLFIELFTNPIVRNDVVLFEGFEIIHVYGDFTILASFAVVDRVLRGHSALGHVRVRHDVLVLGIA
ncbi:hypothetical protein D3C79_1016690 [compost metagenome]